MDQSAKDIADGLTTIRNAKSLGLHMIVPSFDGHLYIIGESAVNLHVSVFKYSFSLTIKS